MLDVDVIDHLKDVILSVVPARRIILFGSRAAGNAMPESDIDILIVVDDTTDGLRQLRQALHVEISSLVATPCDVLVEHESTFVERSSLPTIERTISRSGISLYAA